MKSQTRRIVGQIGFVTGVFLIFGLYFFVRAVSPGAVKNPAFDPSSDDVDAMMGLDCKLAQGTGSATCPAGYVLTGGMGACEDNDAKTPYYFTPITTTNTYTASCENNPNLTTAYAVCCRIVAL